ncbi:MAG: hypothetical protein LLF92_11110 [Planctomycetaceae bacterium]|nr:hypothetical protein [Planctomycetaceae bacterium]
MDKKIKLILASLIFSSVIAFLVFLYIITEVKHLLPTKAALILGAAVTIGDSLAALYLLSRPAKPKE